MNRLLKLQNAIMPYAWGSHSAIAELLGQPVPSDSPQAELWMGAHPKAPSKVWYQGRRQSLAELVRQDPLPIVGQWVLSHFGAQLPFLFKVLAVAQPLSIQAHPDQQMARQGFARENERDIPLSAPHRNYRDDRHKPECVCALTPFLALCGFRQPAEIRRLLEPICPSDFRPALDALGMARADQGLRTFFEGLMGMASPTRHDLLNHIVPAARKMADQEPAYDWLVRLNEAYPGDVGVLSPLILHLIRLQPGQALFLPSGRLHAYLEGVAIELMANSDNVLRGGLTPKHVNVDELLRVLDFQYQPVSVIAPRPLGPQKRCYPSPVEEFALCVLDLQPDSPYDSGPRAAVPEILLCIQGSAEMAWPDTAKGMHVNKGESVLVPAAVTRYTIQGPARLYKATVNPSTQQTQ